MTMKKIELLQEIMNDLPIAEHPALNWLERMGIDDDTTAEELDRYGLLLYGIGQQRLTKVLFAVLDVKPVHSVEQFEQIVDDVHAGRWILEDDIKSEAQLHYFLTHDYEEKPTPDMPLEELFCGNVEPFRAIEMLEEQRRWGHGGLSCYGWVHYEEA